MPANIMDTVTSLRCSRAIGQGLMRTASPTTPPKEKATHFSSLVNFIVRTQRHSKESKANHTVVESGDPQTHLGLENNFSGKTGPFRLSETFVCTDAVDMHRLLQATRTSLLNYSTSTGSNALVDEKWSYVICGPKQQRHEGKQRPTYRVNITYTACTVRATQSDKHQPVALNKVANVPGCMTILDRKTDR